MCAAIMVTGFQRLPSSYMAEELRLFLQTHAIVYVYAMC